MSPNSIDYQPGPEENDPAPVKVVPDTGQRPAPSHQRDPETGKLPWMDPWEYSQYIHNEWADGHLVGGLTEKPVRIDRDRIRIKGATHRGNEVVLDDRMFDQLVTLVERRRRELQLAK